MAVDLLESRLQTMETRLSALELSQKWLMWGVGISLAMIVGNFVVTNQTEHLVALHAPASSELGHRSHPIGKPKHPRLKKTRCRQLFPVHQAALGAAYDPGGG
jgi:hypothetical protein